MYKNYKVVVNTAAGRRRYMQYLIPYIVASGVVDRYDIWVNTHNGADIEFFKRIAEKYSVVNLVWQPDGIVNGISSINAFYKKCIEPDTIYFKLDDDIIWMEPQAIEKMVKFRVENPNYFLVSPLVINNSLSTYLLQLENKIRLDQYYSSSASHPVLWKSGAFASDLHLWFLEKYLKNGNWSHLYVGRKEMGMTRFSINAILWFGDEMRKFNGVVPGDDEEFMSCIYPTKEGKSNAWNGDVIMSHFAFFTQREQLDKQNILEQYGYILDKIWKQDREMELIHSFVQSLMREINENECDLIKIPSPYKKVVAPQTKRSKFKKFIPKNVIEVWNFLRDKREKRGVIKDD